MGTKTPALSKVQSLRSTLRGAEDTIFDLVCSRTTLEQWVEWLRTPLEHAIATGNADLMTKMQGAGAEANAVHSAVRGSQAALVSELLRQGASPSEPDENGDAPLHVAVQVGHGDILSLLLRQGAAVDGLDSGGRSALHLAAGAAGGAGSLDLVRRLVSAGADLSLRHGDRYDKSALDWAAFHGHVKVMRSLIQHGVDVNATSDETDFTALHVGASNNQVGAIDVLVEAGADIDAGRRETSLHVAAKLGLSEAVAVLLKHGAAADKLDANGRSALHVAVKGGHVAAARALLAAGAKPDLRRGEHESTLLDLAAQGGHADILTALAQRGADVNIANVNGRTALGEAAVKNAVAVIDALVAAGADVHAGAEETPLHLATRRGHFEAAVALLRHGADTNKLDAYGNSALHDATSSNMVEALLAAGAKPNLRGGFDRTALGVAADRGRMDVVKTLVQHRVSLNAADSLGRTPLHEAASSSYGNLPVVEILLAAGARVDVPDESGETPLYAAAEGMFVIREVIAALMRYGASSTAFAADGQAPLHVAIKNGRVHAAETLLIAGANVALRNEDGDPPLCIAAEQGDVRMLNVLIQHGADVKTTDSEGRTALHVAALRQREDAIDDAIDALVAARADLEAENAEGMTPLQCASRSGSTEVFSTLLKHGANVGKRGANGRGVIHEAAQRDNDAFMRLILASGVDANLQDGDGRTALHLVNPSCPAIAEALLEHGADIDARDLDDYTALHRVAYRSDVVAYSIEILISAGAAIEARDETGRTPLHHACTRSNILAMRALLRSGADLRARDDNWQTPLHAVVDEGCHDVVATAKGVDLLLRWGADETATVSADGSGDRSRGKTAAQLWEDAVRSTNDFQPSSASVDAAPVRKLLAEAQKDRTWRRRGWLVLARAFPSRVRLKAGSKNVPSAARARNVRARGVAAPSEEAQADAARARARPVRGLSGVVADVVTFQEEGVFRNVVEFL
eukprot:g8338.t1